MYSSRKTKEREEIMMWLTKVYSWTFEDLINSCNSDPLQIRFKIQFIYSIHKYKEIYAMWYCTLLFVKLIYPCLNNLSSSNLSYFCSAVILVHKIQNKSINSELPWLWYLCWQNFSTILEMFHLPRNKKFQI